LPFTCGKSNFNSSRYLYLYDWFKKNHPDYTEEKIFESIGKHRQMEYDEYNKAFFKNLRKNGRKADNLPEKPQATRLRTKRNLDSSRGQ
jgi:hypothetical protein